MSKPRQVVQQGVTAVQPRPTDINIPQSIDKIVPEVELYRRLHEAEKRIDIFTARKMNDLGDSIPKIQRKRELLRIFIYNTAENQPWQTSGPLIQQQQQQQQEDPSWTLRIEGRLVDKMNGNDPARPKFSSFISGISIDLIPNNKQEQQQQQQPPMDPTNPQVNLPQPQTQQQNIVEWHEPADPKVKRVHFDGLDVKRPGSENLKARITIQPKEYPAKLKTSPGLSALLGVSETTQHDAVYSVWQYIQLNNLQSSEDKRMINCDENLSKLFGVPTFNFKQIMELLSRHLSPNKPIELEYEIRCDKASTLGELCIDVEVPVDENLEAESWKSESKKLIAEHDEVIKELNTKIVLGIQALHNSHRKYQFYEKLEQDPVNFFKDFIESHSKLLKILAGDEGYNEEAVRRSDFYTDEMLSENVDILLKTYRM